MTYWEYMHHLVATGRVEDAVTDLETQGWSLSDAFLWAANVANPSTKIECRWV